MIRQTLALLLVKFRCQTLRHMTKAQIITHIIMTCQKENDGYGGDDDEGGHEEG